jgi:hypothetical protein
MAAATGMGAVGNNNGIIDPIYYVADTVSVPARQRMAS